MTIQDTPTYFLLTDTVNYTKIPHGVCTLFFPKCHKPILARTEENTTEVVSEHRVAKTNEKNDL